MSERQRCEALVGEPPGYWHHHQCRNSAKLHVRDIAGGERFVCGIHWRGPQRLIRDGFVSRGKSAVTIEDAL